MDIVTYVLSKVYSDKKSAELSNNLTSVIEALQAELDAFKAAMASGMLYKGSVDTVADLEAMDTSSVKVGDVYTVKADQGEYVWTGSEWFPIGEDYTEEFASKQDKLTAGTDITISDDSVISARKEVQVVSALPETGVADTVYVSTADLQVYIWDEDAQGYKQPKTDLANVVAEEDDTVYIIDGGDAQTI